jgi:very-short-patch-repair endonuclease
MMGLVADIKTHHRIGNYVVDIYIPELNLALEYQGKQHFQQAQYGDLKR